MVPEIITISHTVIDWPVLKKNITSALGQSPSRASDQCPVKLSEVAEYLLYVAYLKYAFEKDALTVLRNMPQDCMDYVHYTFLIACDEKVYLALLNTTGITFAAQRVFSNIGSTSTTGEQVYCILVTGPLSAWFHCVVSNLTNKFVMVTSNYRILFDKLLILLDQDGLGELFYDYRKVTLQDKTFKLERK